MCFSHMCLKITELPVDLQVQNYDQRSEMVSHNTKLNWILPLDSITLIHTIRTSNIIGEKLFL